MDPEEARLTNKLDRLEVKINAIGRMVEMLCDSKVREATHAVKPQTPGHLSRTLFKD